MSDKVDFMMDDQEVLSYDRSQRLPDKQKEYLDNMDKEMAKGFVLVDQSIEQPNFQQKTQFVALNCVNALQQGNDQMAIIMFTYLVNRMPDLKQAKTIIKDLPSGQKIGIEFIFDDIKPKGEKIHFQTNLKAH